MDELCQIVFEKTLAVGRKESDDLLIVGRVGGGEAEIDLLALFIERRALQPEGDGAVLDVRESLRVVDLEADLAVRRRDILIEQLAHPLGIDPVGRNLVAETGGIVKAQRDRLVDLRERLSRAG